MSEHGTEPDVHASAPSSSGNALGQVDSAFKKVVDYVGKQISTFVAFLFFLFTAGAVFGAIIAVKFPGMVLPFILAPAIMGLIAYYNRTIATILFILFLGFFLL